MSHSEADVTKMRALVNRAMQFWNAHCGWPVAIALVLGVAAAAVQWQLVPTLQREGVALHEQRLAAEQRAAQRAAANDAAVPQAAADTFPGIERRGRDVGALLRAAQLSGVSVARADYAIEPVAGARVTRLRAQLPVVGTYGEVRKFIAAILNSLPHLALESVQIERTTTKAARLQANVRVVLFYQADTQ